MKICILTQTFPRFEKDTAAPFMKGFAEGLVEAGNEVIVLAPFSPLYGKKKRHDSFRLQTYKYIFPNSLHLLGYSQTLVNDKRLKLRVAFLAPLMMFFGCIALTRLVKKEKIEVVSAHWILPNGFIAGIVHVLTGVSVVCTLPGSDVYVAKKKPLFRKMALFAAAQSDGITSNSMQLKDDLKALGARIKNFKMIIYSVDNKKFRPEKTVQIDMRKKYNIQPEQSVIVSVGRLVEKKGFMYLIKAASKVVKKNKNVVFFIIGSGSQKEQLQKEIKKLGLTKFFVLLGNIGYDQLSMYYNFADIFILPSIRDQEGNLDDQSVAVVEAMSCGKPVITTDFPGYKYVIDNNINGLLVKEKDIMHISQAILKLIHDRSFREKMGAAARRKVVTEFSWKAVGKEYTQFFKSL